VGGREEVESGVYFGWAGLDLGQEGNEVGALGFFLFLRLPWRWLRVEDCRYFRSLEVGLRRIVSVWLGDWKGGCG